jgi:hypothetical protein
VQSLAAMRQPRPAHACGQKSTAAGENGRQFRRKLVPVGVEGIGVGCRLLRFPG